MSLSLAPFVYQLHFGHQFLYQIMYIKAVIWLNVLDFYFFQDSNKISKWVPTLTCLTYTQVDKRPSKVDNIFNWHFQLCMAYIIWIDKQIFYSKSTGEQSIDLSTLFFFYKNLVYKNIKASNSPKIKNILGTYEGFKS